MAQTTLRPFSDEDVRRLEGALAFVRENYVKGVTLAEAGNVSGMNRPAA